MQPGTTTTIQIEYLYDNLSLGVIPPNQFMKNVAM